MSVAAPTVPPIISSTNLGPLTTSISFPANCLNDLYDLNTYGLGYPWTYETQGCAISTCCPSNNFYTVGWGWFSSYYSPAVCPSQYKSCAPPAVGLSSASGETIIFCCPEKYFCPETQSDGILYWACQSLLSSTSTPVTVLDGVFDQRFLSTRPFTLDPGFINSYQVAYPIQIRFKQSELTTSRSEVFIGTGTTSTDLSTAAATTGNSVVASTSSTSSTSSASAGSSSSPTSSHETGGLSTGAKAGIGVGVAIGVLLILGLSMWLFILRRKHKRLRAQMSGTPPTMSTNITPANPDVSSMKQHELFDQSYTTYQAPRSELEARVIGTNQSLRTELP